MLEGENVIIFSSDDWESGLKSSKYHIATRLAKKNKVFFVNSVGLRNPTASSSDLKRIVSKLRSWAKGWKRVQENLYVYTPIVLPLHSVKFVQRINKAILVLTMKIIQHRAALKSPILLIFIPNMGCVVGHLHEKSVVYYCIDELMAYEQVNSQIFAAMENDLLKKADCMITCSKSLLERKGRHIRHAYHVPHGVDWQHFQRTLHGDLEIPHDIRHLKKPVVGYFGFISDDWIDFDLINYIARQKPEWNVVLIGKTKADLSGVLSGDNIHFLGVKDFALLPAYSKAFDVAIIPFKINQLTQDSNPLKLYEYLSSGLPVVSVRIPEIEKYAGTIRIADDPQSFVREIQDALRGNSRESALLRSEAMRHETWEDRVERISEIISAHAGGAKSHA